MLWDSMSSNNENGRNGPNNHIEKQSIIDLDGTISWLENNDRPIDGKKVLGFLKSIREGITSVSETATVDPEEMPTCNGCGGQKEHPSKEFSYPPENGLCANELKECGPLEYYEGEACPLCFKDYDDNADNSQFFSHSEGGGSAGDLEHYYSCPHCNGEWVNISAFITKEVN